MPSKKVNGVRAVVGAVQINTTFIDGSPAGDAAWYLAQGEIDPRRGVALALSNLFAPLGAALRGKSAEEVETIILSSERCHADWIRQAREQMNCDRQANLVLNDESAPHGVLTDSNEDLSNLFN